MLHRMLARRFTAAAAKLPILASDAEVLQRLRANVPDHTKADILACYSSAVGGIVTDAAMMHIPVDDHGFHRGHCVFDTTSVDDGKAFGLTMHLERLLGSARQAKIIDALTDGSALRESLRSIILQTIAATGRRECVFVRYWLTAGRGDFSISPKNCTPPNFYCIAQVDMHSADKPRGLSAAIVPVPLKPPLLATMKSNNYLINALVAMEAEARGADQGIQIGDDGLLAESSVATIAVVDARGVLRSPPASNILSSTTWMRVQELSAKLVADGLLNGCSTEPVRREELGEATEILTLGGGWVEPIIALDGQPVGSDGLPGRVWRALDTAVRADFHNPDYTDLVPY